LSPAGAGKPALIEIRIDPQQHRVRFGFGDGVGNTRDLDA